MRKKGFTLVELLVVISIIALLMGILMPALARVRQIAYRLYCGTNLSGIGKAMLIYSNDFDDELPRAGLPSGGWGSTVVWNAATRSAAYVEGNATITSNFYLLVKYAEVTPQSFLCKGDSDVHEFKTSDYGSSLQLVNLWDFGPQGQKHCSYSYHTPFYTYGLTSSSGPGMAIAGDPNPWLSAPGMEARSEEDWTAFDPDGDKQAKNRGNALTHQEDGQNILFVDGHTSFEKNSACGPDDDNVYTRWTAHGDSGEKMKGTRSTTPSELPQGRNDVLLLTDNRSTDR